MQAAVNIIKKQDCRDIIGGTQAQFMNRRKNSQCQERPFTDRLSRNPGAAL